MKKFKMYPTENFWEMVDGLADASYGINILLKDGRLPVLEGGRMAAEKFLVDEEDPESFFETETETAEEAEIAAETENDFSDATINHDMQRAARHKAAIKAKKNALYKARHTKNGGYEPIYRGDNGKTKGEYIPISEWATGGENKYWENVVAAKKAGNRQRYDWKKEMARKARHEGKNICFNYEADEETEMEDMEDLEELEELEVMEHQQWLNDLENFRATQELEIWEPEDWEPEDEDDDYIQSLEDLEAMERADHLEWLQELEDEVFGTGIERECSYYRLFLSDFNLWTLFEEWKKRKEA